MTNATPTWFPPSGELLPFPPRPIVDLEDYATVLDQDLGRLFREGDAVAFDALMERHSRSIYKFTLRFLRDPADAEEATQQTLVQAFESLSAARPETSVRPWLFQVARNKCIDLLRKRRTVPLSSFERAESQTAKFDQVDVSPLPADLYEREELQHLLREAIAALPVRSREVVLMRYVGELSFAEIGHSLEMPENTAKTLFRRSKSTLRSYLSNRM